MSKSVQSYHKLIVYQKSKDLILLIYSLTKTFPKHEQFVLLPQMRRAAISVGANIVEGYSKHSTKDFRRFLDISIGSITELEFFVELSRDLNYINDKDYQSSSDLILEVKKLLYSFRKSLE